MMIFSFGMFFSKLGVSAQPVIARRSFGFAQDGIFADALPRTRGEVGRRVSPPRAPEGDVRYARSCRHRLRFPVIAVNPAIQFAGGRPIGKVRAPRILGPGSRDGVTITAAVTARCAWVPHRAAVGRSAKASVVSNPDQIARHCDHPVGVEGIQWRANRLPERAAICRLVRRTTGSTDCPSVVLMGLRIIVGSA